MLFFQFIVLPHNYLLRNCYLQQVLYPGPDVVPSSAGAPRLSFSVEDLGISLQRSTQEEECLHPIPTGSSYLEGLGGSACPAERRQRQLYCRIALLPLPTYILRLHRATSMRKMHNSQLVDGFFFVSGEIIAL
jgi:hypothetical protein